MARSFGKMRTADTAFNHQIFYMYIRNFTSNRPKSTSYMVNTSTEVRSPVTYTERGRSI